VVKFPTNFLICHIEATKSWSIASLAPLSSAVITLYSFSMLPLVICYSINGGAYAVARQRASILGAKLIVISSAGKWPTYMAIMSSGVCNIEFHQPQALALALLFSIFRDCSQCSVWLHESSFYSFRFQSLRLWLSTASRFLIIQILRLRGVRLNPVSSYVSISYCIKPPRNSANLLLKSYFATLPPSSLKLEHEEYHQKLDQRSAILFLRSFHNDARLLASLPRFCANLQVSRLTIIGATAAFKLPTDLKCTTKMVGLLSPDEFRALLRSSFLLVSPFTREGYGLSVFEAMILGNIVFVPHRGSYAETVYADNFELMLNVQEGTTPRPPSCVLLDAMMRNSLRASSRLAYALSL